MSAISPVDIALVAAAAVLLLCVVAGLWRAAAGPGTGDRITAFVLLGTTGAALLVVLAAATGAPALRDAAITVVALATVVTLVLRSGAGR
ncbi:monovalent cation/H+ antiporter complex subunit F [Sediminivirga luteola]|uniref:Multicomponent Na+:H+ antiporter subunit F n=1 Tax=Sediminivirga luteola TaxID=1774748 RepID=A0A8J2XMA0_9MICO|nr:monovalent cation/H+ antiporter complex subunit F [Sediminivirga luteola]MCI2265353.1 monovalent cation/H+ antiporter complex subunit F [Sediminivirga luteola]GGA24597.1 hypothetical protein GCM10011333_29550 [Sediminivirga luteola]